jgi:hypothetical protein
MGFFARLTRAFGTLWLPICVLWFVGEQTFRVTVNEFYVMLFASVIYAFMGSDGPTLVRRLELENAGLRTQLGLGGPAPRAAAANAESTLAAGRPT